MAHDEEQHEQRGFKVEDRRRFTETGETKPNAPADAPASAPPPPAPEASASYADSVHSGAQLSFSAFVISLSTQALAHLGEIPDPVSQSVNVDLHAAQQMIDILGMLRDKTRGNLDPSENQLLEGMLYDLRLRYVERTKR